jgi:hypothetical protein
MHQGNAAGPSLKRQWKELGTEGRALWKELAKRPFPVVNSGEPIVLGAAELFGTLAICKRLEDEAEGVLVRTAQTSTLAEIVVRDYAARFPHRLADKSRLDRRLLGFRQREYPDLEQVGAAALADAAQEL